VLFSADAAQLSLALRQINNLWVPYAVAPFEVVALLVALSLWHAESSRRRLFFYTAGAFVVVEGILVFSFERLDQFGVLVEPVKALLLLIAGVLTLLACLRRYEGDLLREDWFWICFGVSLRYGASAAIGPLAALLMPTHQVILDLALKSLAWISILASLVIARGILCPVLPRPSFGPLSPAFSPSPSSSPPSGPPS